MLDTITETLIQEEEKRNHKTSLDERFIIRTAFDALQPLPPIEYIVDGLISPGRVAVFFGEPGSKKTYSLAHMAACVAFGKPWLNFTTKSVPVLFVNEEESEDDIHRRLAEVLIGENCNENTPLFYMSQSGLMLDDKDDPRILEEKILENNIKLVIIDALTDVMRGDENSKADIQPIFTELRRMANKLSCAFVVIHHCNKTGGYRGSSAIKGAVDLMIKVESKEDENIVNYASEKSRYGQARKWAAMAKWQPDINSFTLETWNSIKQVFHGKAQEYVIRYLGKNGAATLDAIKASADTCSERSARDAVYALCNSGEVFRTNPGHTTNGVQALYALKARENE